MRPHSHGAAVAFHSLPSLLFTFSLSLSLSLTYFTTGLIPLTYSPISPSFHGEGEDSYIQSVTPSWDGFSFPGVRLAIADADTGLASYIGERAKASHAASRTTAPVWRRVARREAGGDFRRRPPSRKAGRIRFDLASVCRSHEKHSHPLSMACMTRT